MMALHVTYTIHKSLQKIAHDYCMLKNKYTVMHNGYKKWNVHEDQYK